MQEKGEEKEEKKKELRERMMTFSKGIIDSLSALVHKLKSIGLYLSLYVPRYNSSWNFIVFSLLLDLVIIRWFYMIFITIIIQFCYLDIFLGL